MVTITRTFLPLGCPECGGESRYYTSNLQCDVYTKGDLRFESTRDCNSVDKLYQSGCAAVTKYHLVTTDWLA